MGFRKVLAMTGFVLSVLLLLIYWLTKADLIRLLSYFLLLVSNVMVLWLALEKKSKGGQGDGSPAPSEENEKIGK